MKYKKISEINSEYIVIEAYDIDDQTYRIGMITENDIPGFIKPEDRYINGTRYLYFDVTEYRSFEEAFDAERNQMDMTEVETLVESLSLMVSSVSDYLLSLNDVLMGIDTVLYNAEKNEFRFIYCPDDETEKSEVNTFNTKLLRFWENVLMRFNYDTDMESTIIIYEAYKKISCGNFDFKRILTEIRGRIEKSHEETTDKREKREEVCRKEYYQKEYEYYDDWQENTKDIGILKDNKKHKKYIFIVAIILLIIFIMLLLSPNGIGTNGNLTAVFGIIVCVVAVYFTKDSVKDFNKKKLILLGDCGKTYLIDKFPCTVGSKIDRCDICIGDKGISREHVVIHKENDNYFAEDLGSTNGTYINEQKIERCIKTILSDGDLLRLGGKELIVKIK